MASDDRKIDKNTASLLGERDAGKMTLYSLLLPGDEYYQAGVRTGILKKQLEIQQRAEREREESYYSTPIEDTGRPTDGLYGVIENLVRKLQKNDQDQAERSFISDVSDKIEDLILPIEKLVTELDLTALSDAQLVQCEGVFDQSLSKIEEVSSELEDEEDFTPKLDRARGLVRVLKREIASRAIAQLMTTGDQWGAVFTLDVVQGMATPEVKKAMKSFEIEWTRFSGLVEQADYQSTDQPTFSKTRIIDDLFKKTLRILRAEYISRLTEAAQRVSIAAPAAFVSLTEKGLSPLSLSIIFDIFRTASREADQIMCFRNFGYAVSRKFFATLQDFENEVWSGIAGGIARIDFSDLSDALVFTIGVSKEMGSGAEITVELHDFLAAVRSFREDFSEYIPRSAAGNECLNGVLSLEKAISGSSFLLRYLCGPPNYFFSDLGGISELLLADLKAARDALVQPILNSGKSSRKVLPVLAVFRAADIDGLLSKKVIAKIIDKIRKILVKITVHLEDVEGLSQPAQRDDLVREIEKLEIALILKSHRKADVSLAEGIIGFTVESITFQCRKISELVGRLEHPVERGNLEEFLGRLLAIISPAYSKNERSRREIHAGVKSQIASVRRELASALDKCSLPEP